jgi:hypothetical protein
MTNEDHSTKKLKIPIQDNFFKNDTYLKSIREKNKKNEWLTECVQCREAEEDGVESKRQQLIRTEHKRINEKYIDDVLTVIYEPERVDYFGRKGMSLSDLSSVRNLTITLNGSCDLMCTTCSPGQSSTWITQVQKSNVEGYVKDGYIRRGTNFGSFDNVEIMEFFDHIDLSDLQQITFTGGETVTFNYFEMIDYFISKCNPEKLSIIFQTNGVNVISNEWLDKLSQLRSVEVSVSVDCIEDKFNYLRRGANWEKVSNNILYYKQLSTDYDWFFVSLEQTISVLSLFYRLDLVQWAEEHNIDYNEHLAFDVYSLRAISNEYVEVLMERGGDWTQYTGIADDVSNDFFISEFINHITWYDATTGSDWKKTFPEIAQFYSDYI